jgi:hypothetical protein
VSCRRGVGVGLALLTAVAAGAADPARVQDPAVTSQPAPEAPQSVPAPAPSDASKPTPPELPATSAPVKITATTSAPVTGAATTSTATASTPVTLAPVTNPPHTNLPPTLPPTTAPVAADPLVPRPALAVPATDSPSPRFPGEAALEAAAAQWPDRVQLLPLARSGDLRPALVAAVWVQNEAPARLPGMLIADVGLGRALEPGARSAPERLGALVLALARRIEADDSVRALLAERPLFIAPSLGPLDAITAQRTFAHDFPSGWLPPGFHGADSAASPGAFPLSTPEAAALSALLAQSQDLAALLLFDARAFVPAPPPDRSGAGPEPDLRWSLLPDAVLAQVAGHPLRHAREDLGITALALDCGAALPDEVFLDQVLALLRAMPRLDIRPRATERIGPDLWQLDFGIEARASSVWSEATAQPAESGVLVCRVELCVLETAALQRQADGAWEALTSRANECRLSRPPLTREVGSSASAASAVGLRIVVRAPVGARVRVVVRSPRLGEGVWSSTL